MTGTKGRLKRTWRSWKDLRGLHHDGNAPGLDCFLDCDCDLFGEPLLDLETAAECLGNSREFGEAQDEMIGNVSNSNLRIVDRGRCGTWMEPTFPVNGTRWCSHRDEMSMSRTKTISSWSSAKTASLMTSVEGECVEKLMG